MGHGGLVLFIPARHLNSLRHVATVTPESTMRQYHLTAKWCSRWSVPNHKRQAPLCPEILGASSKSVLAGILDALPGFVRVGAGGVRIRPTRQFRPLPRPNDDTRWTQRRCAVNLTIKGRHQSAWQECLSSEYFWQ